MNRKILMIMTALFAFSTSLWAADATLGKVDAEYPANHCEFYVNGLTDTKSYYTFDWEYLYSYVSVNEKSLVHELGGTILRVGILANGHDVFLGTPIDPAYYRIALGLQPLLDTGTGGSIQGPAYKLQRFSYFIEVRRKDGRVERLWLSNKGADYSWPDVFNNYPKFSKDMGKRIEIILISDAPNASPVFDQRRSCAQ